MPISFKLEHVIEEVLSEYPKDQQRMLRKLAGVKLSQAEAGRAWPRVLEHKWFLSERLGRDVGLRVAAVDYSTAHDAFAERTAQRVERGVSIPGQSTTAATAAQPERHRRDSPVVIAPVRF
jgi:hypothetical protein